MSGCAWEGLLKKLMVDIKLLLKSFLIFHFNSQKHLDKCQFATPEYKNPGCGEQVLSSQEDLQGCLEQPVQSFLELQVCSVVV